MNILIYGATGGIGKALCEQLYKNHQLFLIGRSMNKMKQIANTLDIPDHRIYCLNDIQTGYSDLCRWLKKQQVTFDVGIHAVGMGNQQKAADLKADTINELFSINLSSAFLFFQAFNAVRTASGYHLIFTGSASVDEIWPKNTLYGASKAGLEYFAQALQKEIKADNGKIWYYKIGSVNTSFFDNLKNHLPPSKMIQPETLAKIITQQLDLFSDSNCHFPIITIRSD